MIARLGASARIPATRASAGARRSASSLQPVDKLSKRLTYALRHGADKLGLQLRPDGFASLDALLSKSSFRGVSRQQVEEVVAADDKGRMSIASLPCEEEGAGAPASRAASKLFIRANQGHSIKGVVDEAKLLTNVRDAADIPVCVHGTSLKSWPSIRKEGLRCMNRTHIHFAAGLPGESGVISGMRRSCKVLIYVDVAAAMSNGVAFFRSSNNVILSSGKDGTLDPRYFSRVEGVPDGEAWTPAATKPASVTTTPQDRRAAHRGAEPAAAAAAAAAAAVEAADQPQRQAINVRAKQPRKRSDWMLDQPATVAGNGPTGSGSGGGGGGGGGGGNSTHREPRAGRPEAGMTAAAAAGSEAAAVDIYAILDFEATCEDRGIDGGRFGPVEVIEFPTVLLDASSLDVIDEFRVYVRPVRNPTLTPFCTSLTGIDQSTVDGGVLFEEALVQHTDFLRRNSCLPGQKRPCLFITCGDWDLKTMMPAQCKLIDACVPSHFKAWANIKKVFREVMQPERRGSRERLVPMTGMLSSLGLTLEGRHHSGLDDSRNIARIAKELCRRSRRRIQATTPSPR